MIIYLYRWKLKPGKEADFANAWAIVTQELKAKCNSLGSRLHLGSDGLFYGYAQWPDKETREKAQLNDDRSLIARKQMTEAIEESLPEIALQPKSDFLSVSNVPTIETDRLRLRSHQVADFINCAAMWADPVVTRYIGGKPSSEQQTWARLLNYVGHWTLMGFGYWLIEEKNTHQFLGELGFADFKRDIQPSIVGKPELGWALATPSHGKGYATEAIRAAIAWGDKHLKSKQTVCIINPDNLASIRVAEKCGYQESKRTTYNGQPTILFSREHH